MVPHDWPLVVRAQPVVSVSVAVAEPQMPVWQMASVRVRVRDPVSEQVPAYVQLPYGPYVAAPQLTLFVERMQPAVSVSVVCTAMQVPLPQRGSVRTRVRVPEVLQVAA